MRARLGDFTQSMEKVGGALEQNIQGRFEIHTDPNGQPWKVWALSNDISYPRPGTQAAAGPDGQGNGKVLDRYGFMLKI